MQSLTPEIDSLTPSISVGVCCTKLCKEDQVWGKCPLTPHQVFDKRVAKLCLGELPPGQ